MGKYQLDDKGKALVQRFHEKHSKGGVNKKDRVASLREQFLNKKQEKVRIASRFSYSGEGNMELRRPRLADKETVLEMMAEFEKSQSAHDGGFWDAENFDYEEWLETNLNKEMGINLPENRVPSIQFVLFDESGHALGFLNLRLRLNEGLLNYAGHIGYSIRPSERGKGYAKEALRQGLQVAKEKNIHRALVTCSTENPASRAVILANGGQLEDVRNGTERYWIDLE